MQLDTSRFFSDCLIFDETSVSKFRIENGFWIWIQRVISWIWSSTEYTEENRRTVDCFQRYLVEALGAARLQRISSRYNLNWDQMKKSPLLSRDVAKIFIGVKCITVEDINEKIQNNPRFEGIHSFFDLDSRTLLQLQNELKSPFDHMWEVAEITNKIYGSPTEFFSRLFYDPFLADRERHQIVKEHPEDSFENFMHNMVARVIKKEPDVGAIIPAPNHPDGHAQFYYVSGKLVTGKGMVSYMLHPCGNDTNLEPIRLFRGTSPRNSEIDALSTIITDLEKDLGMRAYKSGHIFEPIIQEKLGTIKIEGGHSMGSTLVQHRLVDFNHIRKAYLYCGPGVTEEEVERFNQKNLDVHLVIRVANNDRVYRVGQVHLGYNPPPNVQVDCVRYRSINRGDIYSHVAIWGKEPERYEIEEVLEPEVRDHLLCHRNGRKEYYRSLIGPILAWILECLRDLVRLFINSRIHIENGLKIGYLHEQRWRVDHFHVV